MNLREIFIEVQQASHELLFLNDTEINKILTAVADAATEKADYILSENAKDLERMDPKDPKYDRLQLTKARLDGIADDMRSVAQLPSPVGRILKETILPNGLRLKKVSVPFGVIGIIYEARPNVSFDVFSLCLKSGNACILKGGSDADFSNRAIVSVIHEVLKRQNVNPQIVKLLPADREATTQLLKAREFVDLIIPRGSSSLINYVRENRSRHLPYILRQQRRPSKRHSHRQQRQDPAGKRVQRLGLSPHRFATAERSARSLPPLTGQQGHYLCRSACLPVIKRELSGGTSERSHERRLRHRVS